MKYLLSLSILSGFFLLAACQSKPKPTDWTQIQQKLDIVYPRKAPPVPGDWLTDHPETYQSFKQYQQSQPTRVDSVRKTIYIALLGDFSSREKEIIHKTARYLQAVYGLPVRYTRLPSGIDLYKHARQRSDKEWQLLTTYLMQDVLKPHLPSDAAILIGLTTIDLYPKESWGYVFGQATLKDRVGVWSMNRFGDASSPEGFQKCFLATLKTATHEIGHMFSIRHCVRYECCMNGANHLLEQESRPTYFCPDCLTKLCWNLHQDVTQNLTRVQRFWAEEHNQTQVDFYARSLKAL